MSELENSTWIVRLKRRARAGGGAAWLCLGWRIIWGWHLNLEHKLSKTQAFGIEYCETERHLKALMEQFVALWHQFK